MQKLSYTTLLIVEYQGAQTRCTDQQDSVNRKVHNADRGVQWIAECLAGQCWEEQRNAQGRLQWKKMFMTWCKTMLKVQ